MTPHPPPLLGATARGAMVCAALLCAAGLLVLAGYAFDVPPLRDLLLGVTDVRQNTAIGLILLGIAGLNDRRGKLAFVTGLSAAFLGTATLIEYVGGYDFGIDALLFEPAAGVDPRMAVRTAAALSLAGGVEALRARGKASRLTHFTSAVVGFLALLSLVGHSYGARFLPDVVGTQVAPATALLLLIWTGGYFLRHRLEGGAGLLFESGAWGASARMTAGAALLAPIFFGFLFLSGAKRGWYDMPFAVALMVTTSGVTFLLTIGRYSARLREHQIERDRAEQASRASDSRFRSLYDANLVGIAFWNADGQVTQANDEYLRILGVERHQLSGLTWVSLTAPESLHADEHALNSLRETGRCEAYEKDCIRPDGSRVSLLVAAADLPASEERIAFAVDVTERVEARRSLAHSVALLQERVAVLEGEDRDAAVLVAETDHGPLREQLEALTHRLTTANEELESFSYSVSHDLRAPLRAIDGFSRELQTNLEQQLDERERHYLSRIRAAAQRMSLLIDALLELSRLSRKPMQRTAVDASALAKEVALEAIERSRRPVLLEIEAGIVIDADPHLLRIVFENVIGNAVKFSAKGDTPRIDVFSTGPQRVEIRDNGVGFESEFVGKIFAPFQRLHSSEFEGTGIGLALVQRIIRRHGGTVRAESARGRGATFHLYFGGDVIRTGGSE
ncbi:MAG TPA: ATP-binding protein [Thermoanaerobaculia bacterium]